MLRDNFGDRMKQYEIVPDIRLMRRVPVILRIDGKAFHTFTRGFNKPFDDLLVDVMRSTMVYLCNNIQGAVFGYTQSDEISIALIDYQNLDTDAWFDYRIEKMCSVGASMATLCFNRVFAIQAELSGDEKYSKAVNIATFDCRAFNIPKEEVCNYFIWRQKDAERNSVQGLAQSLFSHKELGGLSCENLKAKMYTEKNVNWNDLKGHEKRGSMCYRGYYGWNIYDASILVKNRDLVNTYIFVGE